MALLNQYNQDAFVSYNHNDDYLWIQNDLVPRVEEGWGFKLCVGQRDFIAGIFDDTKTIMMTIYGSITTLCQK